MTAAKNPNTAKLRASLRAAQLPATDAAGAALAAELAGQLDAVRHLDRESQLEVIAKLGPMYLRTLTALGLTKAGRGVSDAAGKSGGKPAGAAEHQRHRERFRERGRASHG